MQRFFISHSLPSLVPTPNKIETEFNWQKLIFRNFRDKITLDKKEIDNELNNLLETQSNLQEYELAEIEISLKNNSEDKNTMSQNARKFVEVNFDVNNVINKYMNNIIINEKY